VRIGRGVLPVTVAMASLASAILAGQTVPSVADAVRQRDAAALASLLNGGADVNAPLPDGATALHWAAHWNDADTVRQLLAAGADVNASNQYGVPPLSLAIVDAEAEVVRLLLDAGADVHRALPGGETPLMTAARAGKADVTRLLLERGAAANAREGTHGQTALMWAFSRGHLEIARLLLDHGADLHAASNSGFTPLLFAARAGDPAAARLLLDRGADVNRTANDGVSPLHVAVVRGHVPLAILLLERGADPDAAGPGYTALHWASGVWDSQTTHEYVGTPPQPAGWHDEWRALIGLKGERKLALIAALLAHGATVNARTSKSPPHFGYSFSSGLHTGGALHPGATPFMLAGQAADVDAMRLLLAGGADPAVAAGDGTTPLMAAAGMASIEEEMSTPEADRLRAVGFLLDLGADVNAANEHGNTALHATAYVGFPKVAEYLIGRGAAVNPLNGKDETPLRVAEGTIIIAMFFIHENVAEVLRAHGGTSDGSGVCTAAILKSASVNSQSTVCETAPPDRRPEPAAVTTTPTSQ